VVFRQHLGAHMLFVASVLLTITKLCLGCLCPPRQMAMPPRVKTYSNCPCPSLQKREAPSVPCDTVPSAVSVMTPLHYFISHCDPATTTPSYRARPPLPLHSTAGPPTNHNIVSRVAASDLRGPTPDSTSDFGRWEGTGHLLLRVALRCRPQRLWFRVSKLGSRVHKL
jgi:hypothetical protein